MTPPHTIAFFKSSSKSLFAVIHQRLDLAAQVQGPFEGKVLVPDAKASP